LPEKENDELTLAEIAPLGEIANQSGSSKGPVFRRGVSLFPTVGDLVQVATPDDLALVYAQPEAAAVRIGTIYQDRSIPAFLIPDGLLGKHFAVLGTTGSGKSCATALILRRLLEAYDKAHILVLDPHNEYTVAFKEFAEVVDSRNLELPHWLFNFEELSALIFKSQVNDRDVAGEAAILADLVVRAKQAVPANCEKTKQIHVDTPVPYSIVELLNLLKEDVGRLGRPDDTADYLRLSARLNTLLADNRYRFIFGGISIHDKMAKILSRLLRLPVDGKPMTILDLSAIPSDVLNIVVSVLCRIVFDFATFGESLVPVLLVCEEAHRYLPEDSRLGFEPTKRILSRIAKEGRKYGVSLCIVSQRPSDLALSALSQCNTIFALRLTNQTDQEFVRGIMPDWGNGLLDFLPSLRNAEAIVVGEGTSVPARVQFDEIPEQQLPRSRTAVFSHAWQEGGSVGLALDEIIARWRTER
jgi:hypothetical protein